MKRFKKGWVLCIAVLAITVGIYYWIQTPDLRYVVSNETTHFTEPLLADGRVDYRSVLNNVNGAGVTPENNALIPLLQVIDLAQYGNANFVKAFYRELGIEPVEMVGELNDFYRELEKQFPIPDSDTAECIKRDESLARIAPWTERDHLDWAAVLKQQNELIDIVVEASKKPRYFEPRVSENPDEKLLGIAYDEPAISQVFRSAEQNLYFRAMLRLGNDQIPEAIEDLKTVRRLTRLLDQSTSVFDASISRAIQSIALDVEVFLFQSDKVTTEQLNDYLEFVQEQSPFKPPRFERETLIERLLALDLIAYVSLHGYDKDDPELERLWRNADESAQILATYSRISDTQTTMREINRLFDELQAVLNSGDDEQANELTEKREALSHETFARLMGPQALVERSFGTPGSRAKLLGEYVVSHMTISPYSYIDIKKSNLVYQSLTELAILIELYRRSSGNYPATLSDLVGDYITAVPQDPFAAGPFSKDSIRYERTVDGYVVYSVGRDGIDNYGTGESDLDEFGPTDIRIRVGEVVK